MGPEHIEKTDFQAKYGQYEYPILLMGLCNTSTTFTIMMNEVLNRLMDRFCTVHFNDILIISKAVEEHRIHVKQVLDRLREHKLCASPKKCHYMCTQVEFLGNVVSDKGLKLNPKNSRRTGLAATEFNISGSIDASQYSVGGTLTQVENGEERMFLIIYTIRKTVCHICSTL